MKKLLFFISVLFLFTDVQSQELLGVKKKQIKRAMAGQGAYFQHDGIEIDLADKRPFNIITYGCDAEHIKTQGMYEYLFFLRDNRCYRYFIAYTGDIFRQKLIDKFNSKNSGLIRTNEELTWKDDHNKYRIQIRSTLKNGKPSPMFMLQILKNS
jgi:hypothetical protein